MLELKNVPVICAGVEERKGVLIPVIIFIINGI
jgi:hypothetical protein